jgi:succinate-semialdehyde dehydrogenase/glutarate-semialdehyde dehydrogenase
VILIPQLAQQAGFPPGVLNVITSQDSPKVGQVICASKTIKKVSFTGSTGVGKILAKQCAGTLKKYVASLFDDFGLGLVR